MAKFYTNKHKGRKVQGRFPFCATCTLYRNVLELSTNGKNGAALSFEPRSSFTMLALNGPHLQFFVSFKETVAQFSLFSPKSH